MKQLFTLGALLFALNSFAQFDTEFWFGAPDLSMGTGFEARRDSSIFLVLSTLNQSSTVIISQPANPSFQPITVNLGADAVQQINLGMFLSLIETKPANAVLNTGLLIRSTKPITAYYEVRGLNNSDLFSLKGKNSLGTRFHTPFQTEYQNNQSLNSLPYIPAPRSGFIVMAIRDQTTVTITPGNELLDHPTGVPFTIMLNRGQTYYCEALNWEAGSQPVGSLVESNLPITVTIKDDLLDLNPANDGGADVLGYQLISEEFLGLEHIVVKSGLVSNGDRVIICGTVDNTDVFIDGSAIPITIDAGDQYSYGFTAASSFIEATEKIAVLQVSGLNDQIAGAVIPALECTGSQQVGFVRGSSGPFFLTVTIKAGSEGGFELNGNPSLVPSSAFSPVTGSNGEYVFARIPFSTGQLAVGQSHLLTNFGTELFHVGVLNQGGGSSCNYGYFSAFSYLNLGKTSEVCLGDSAVLDAGPGKTSYLWSTGEITQTITVFEAGIYTVTVSSGSGCLATDDIEVTYYEPPIDLGANTTLCEGDSLIIEIDGTYNFEWQDGSTGNFFIISEPGIYWLDVSDFQQCRTRDSITVAVSPRPASPAILGDTIYCNGETLNLSISDSPNASYLFTLPNGSVVPEQNVSLANIGAAQAGWYSAGIIVDGCPSFLDSVLVSIAPIPVIDLGTDVSVCEDETITLNAGDPGALAYVWQDGSVGNLYNPLVSGTYFVDATNEFNCIGSDTVNVIFRPYPAPLVISANQTSFCEGDDVVLSTPDQANTAFLWTNTFGDPVSNTSSLDIPNALVLNAGFYNVIAELDGCIGDLVSFDLNINSNPVFSLPADTSLCPGNEVTISGPDGFAAYNWSNGDQTQAISVSVGTFSLEVTTAEGCFGSAETTIDTNGPTAAFQINPDTVFAPNTVLNFVDISMAGPIAPITAWAWNFGDGTTAVSQNPIYAYTQSGNFVVTLIVTDEQGCSDQAQQEVFSRFKFRIPEGFSPNGDGLNDEFVIRGLEGLNGTMVQIFNRWGAIVYETNNYNSGNFWDGQDNTDGTYFYIVKLATGETFNGPVTIAR